MWWSAQNFAVLPLSEAREFFADFCLITEVVLVRAPLLPVCRDPKDDYLLALAKAAKAEI